MKTIELVRGEKYPLSMPPNEGAHVEFLRSGSVLQIRLDGMDSTEEESLRFGNVRAGFLYQNGALIWLFRFSLENREIITLDAPFDVRKIRSDELMLPSIENSQERLMIEIHAIDGLTGVLKGIRGITLPTKLTVAFLIAVQDQFVSMGNGSMQQAKWMMLPPQELIKHVKTYLLGQ